MQGRSVRSDIQRAVMQADASEPRRGQQVPMPRQKPVGYGGGYNPNMTDAQAQEWAQQTYRRGFEAGEHGVSERYVLRKIREGGAEGFYLEQGYREGRKRRQRAIPRPSMPGSRWAPHGDVPK